MTTRAVLFDFGGTLYDYSAFAPGDMESKQSLARSAGIEADAAKIREASREAMRQTYPSYMEQRFYMHRDLFRDVAAAFVRILGGTPEPAMLESYRQLQWALHRRDLVLREGVIETLQTLRGLGLHLGIVSNIDNDQLEHLVDTVGVRDHFDSLLSSETVKSCKPDPIIFEEALSRAGCAPAEALFVGDSLQADVAGSNRVGMRSVLLRPYDRALPADGIQPTHIIRRFPEVLDHIGSFS